MTHQKKHMIDYAINLVSAGNHNVDIGLVDGDYGIHDFVCGREWGAIAIEHNSGLTQFDDRNLVGEYRPKRPALFNLDAG